MSLQSILKGSFTALAATSLLTACGGGGGGSSAGAGGGTTANVSSTLVLNVSQVGGQAAMLTPYHELEGADQLLAVLAQFMLHNAIAHIDDIVVSVDGVPIAEPVGPDGSIMIPLTAGTHTVTFSHEGVESSFVVTVPSDTIVTVNNIAIADDGTITHDPIIVGDGTAVAGQKVLICHKDKKTLSVGAPAQPAHLAHGDTPGACPDTTAADGSFTNGGSEDTNSNNGNNGNSGQGQGRGRS